MTIPLTDPARHGNYHTCYGNVEVVGDGDALCAHFDDFVNLQESPAGFGHSDAEAIAELARDVRRQLAAETERADKTERLKRAVLRAWSRSDRYGPVADGSPYAAGYYSARVCFLKAAEAAKEKK